MNKQQFFLRLNPPRPTFYEDITANEKTIMQKHRAYWTELLNKNLAIVFGPVLDPEDTYSVGVVSVDNEEHLKEIIANDPANELSQYKYYPMNAVFKQ